MREPAETLDGVGLLRLVTWNIKDGGGDRLPQQIDLLAGLHPDILAIQEAKHWDRKDHELVCSVANQLGMQWHLAPSGSHGCHLALLFRWPKVQCLKINPDFACGKFHHTATRALLRIEGVREPVVALHTHLAPFSPEQRLAEVGWLTEYAAPDKRTVLMGDLNVQGIHDRERSDWNTFPAHLQSRHRLILPDGTYGESDRRAMAALMLAGFVDAATGPGRFPQRTAGHWKGSDPWERWDHRSDFTLLSPALRAALHSQLVIDDEAAQDLSDHLPVLTCLRVDAL